MEKLSDLVRSFSDSLDLSPDPKLLRRQPDEHLGREIAIKVLPDVFATDPERLARLEREARLMATVSHPNVAAIHGMEVAGQKHFLVIELVAGQTLAQILEEGALPTEQALHICAQIADGVEAAHNNGIVHRDLKPANVKVTGEGQVKVLDFGLAKPLAKEAHTVRSCNIARHHRFD